MPLRGDWLPALAAFEAAARHQNFAHAATELHLTASAVSHHVRKLEERLGVSLFRRHARGVQLTPEGRRLADAASSALTDVESTLRELRSDTGDRDRVRISTLHSLLNTWLMPRLPAFTEAFPDIRLEFQTDIALARFENGGPDLAIRHGPGHWPGLASYHVMDDALIPLAPPSLAAGVETPAGIARLPLVSDLARQGWPDWFRAVGLHGLHLDFRHSFGDSTDAMEAAALGLGATLGREKIMAPWVDSGRLVQLPGPRITTRWQYHVVHPAHRRLRPPAQRFVDWLLATTLVERAGERTGERTSR